MIKDEATQYNASISNLKVAAADNGDATVRR
jgi:hypothetical protein